MSIYRRRSGRRDIVYDVTCDHRFCPAILEGYHSWDAARQALGPNGWSRVDRHDYCEDHLMKYKRKDPFDET